jgi:TrmH family RNA methyltransferase
MNLQKKYVRTISMKDFQTGRLSIFVLYRHMLTKNRIKFIRSLHQKKHRANNGLFLVEGEKMVEELIERKLPIEALYRANSNLELAGVQVEDISKREMDQISNLVSPPGILAIVPKLEWAETDFSCGKYLVLDQIKDPGNLGTIIRIADWFGLQGIVCDLECVDLYNPKTVQASMGSLFRIPVFYKSLETFISEVPEANFLAADMEGVSISENPAPDNAMLILGSESHGIRKPLMDKSIQRISVPKKGKMESLNVAVAAGILSYWMTL